MRARVWSKGRDAIPAKNDTYSSLSRAQVYTLKIVEVFKGKEQLKQLPGVVSVGVRSPGYMVDLHTPSRDISCSFALHKGKEYLLSAYINNNKLHSNFCDIRQRWTYVTSEERAGVSGRYNESC